MHRTTLLTIHYRGIPVEVEFPAPPVEFARLLGRLVPEVPGGFNCAEISQAMNTVVLSDTTRVTAGIQAVQLSPERMEVLITYIRGLFPEFFNLADVAAANAAYLAKNYL